MEAFCLVATLSEGSGFYSFPANLADILLNAIVLHRSHLKLPVATTPGAFFVAVDGYV